MGEVAIDIGRVSIPASVIKDKKVNWTGRKLKALGLFTVILWMVGVILVESRTAASKISPPIF